MAVIQISRIQHRRGQTAQTGFPQLASGELGWSIDTQELFIGNGSVAEGAPAVGNTQLITEHNINNFFLYAKDGYLYKNGEGLASNAKFRPIQDKLDDFVSLNDFSTSSNLNVTIQNAINYAATIGKPLNWPEGDFNITSTIFLPPLLNLCGAGIGKTNIINTSSFATFQTVDGSAHTFDNPSFSLTTNPSNIKINGFTFINDKSNADPIMQLDCLSDSIIEQCSFIGDISVNSASSTLVQAINFRDHVSYPANITNNVTIKNCIFYKVSDAIVSDYDISNIIISENTFKTLDRGLVFGENTTNLPETNGPRHVKVSDNSFHTINKQAIYEGTTSTAFSSDINSVNNFYYNVGCNSKGDGTSTQAYEILHFGSFGNYSSGDTFDRLEKINSTSTYFIKTSNSKPLVKGPVVLTSKSPLFYEIKASGAGLEMFGFPRSQFSTNSFNQNITIEYTINKPDVPLIRKGTLEIMVSETEATVRDVYTANNDIEGKNVTFSAQVNIAKNLVIVYVSNQSMYLGNIFYTYTVRQ